MELLQLIAQSYQNPDGSIAGVRVLLGAIVLILLTCGPYGVFYERSAFLYKPPKSFPLPHLGERFNALKTVVVILAVLFGLGVCLPVSAPLFVILFGVFGYYVTRFSTNFWITNSHLNVFAALVWISGSGSEYSVDHLIGVGAPGGSDLAAFALTFMQVYIVVLYFQAGLAKLIRSGVTWFTSGQSIRVATILHGTRFGRRLARWKWPFVVAGIFTAGFELLAPLALTDALWMKSFICVAILFHVGTLLVMRISFWFLWALYPAVFWDSVFVPGTVSAHEAGLSTPLGLIICCYMVIQLLQTILGRRDWPFNAHDLFCEMFPEDLEHYVFVVSADTGRRVHALPGEVIPIEYFRTANLVGNVYVRGRDEQKRTELARLILYAINHRPWRTFDETMKSVRKANGESFVSFELVVYRFRLGEFIPERSIYDHGAPVKSLFRFLACSAVHTRSQTEEIRGA